MHYTKFRIRNFKGIKDTTVNFKTGSGAGVFSFVGLNESGKTTILEAIHSFSPDSDTSELVGGDKESGIPFKDRVPRHLISNFSGDVSVSATIRLTDDDKSQILAALKSKHDVSVEDDTLPDELTFERQQRFKNGDFVQSYFSLRTQLNIKTGRKRSYQTATGEIAHKIKLTIYGFTPDIAYFPTFVFDFPKRIFLTEERGGVVSQFYRRVFQDILDHDGQGHTIEESIVRRIRTEERKVPWLDFFTMWNTHDDKDKIQHVMDRASAVVTEIVFGRWNKIFGENAGSKEIIISYNPVEGERRDQNGAVIKSNDHDLYIQFQIRDGTRRFGVNDRSLGFRWFFAFMLFTQFRVARQSTRPILFLFDEPASNLHAAAQQKLVDCFPEVAKNNHMLAYSTHSHYMIEPKWLEQTFIVTNRADAPNESVLESISLDDESLDIQAQDYKSFVNRNPGKTSYFQPILDRLNVVPSKFDLDRSSVIVEGKSDYYILRYAAQMINAEDLGLLPGLGAGTFGALVALHVGWGLNSIFLLDGDSKGTDELARYVSEFGLPADSAISLSDLVTEVQVIEDLLDDEAKAIISDKLSLEKKPTKNQIRRFFQEQLASDAITPLGTGFEEKAKSLIEALSLRIN